MKEAPIIKLVGVSKVYQSGGPKVKALQNVSLELNRGDFVILAGKSGSGKTTLLNIISGIDSQTSGELLFNNAPVQNRNDFRKNEVGMVFQFFNLLSSLTALQNVVLARYINGDSKSDGRSLSIRALKDVKLFKRMHHKPNQLSGGEQQRVAIARALAKNPSILVCDEPTGNLDTETSLEIMNLLKEINRKYQTTIIIASHDKDIEKFANKKIYLKDGKIV